MSLSSLPVGDHLSARAALPSPWPISRQRATVAARLVGFAAMASLVAWRWLDLVSDPPGGRGVLVVALALAGASVLAAAATGSGSPGMRCWTTSPGGSGRRSWRTVTPRSCITSAAPVTS
jgi:hypothetical protein